MAEVRGTVKQEVKTEVKTEVKPEHATALPSSVGAVVPSLNAAMFFRRLDRLYHSWKVWNVHTCGSGGGRFERVTC